MPKTSKTKSTTEKKLIESDDIDQIKQAMETLSQASHKLSEMMYQQATQQQAQQGPGCSGSSQDPDAQADGQQAGADEEEEIIDAEVVEEEQKEN